jgi:hypothetical protein
MSLADFMSGLQKPAAGGEVQTAEEAAFSFGEEAVVSETQAFEFGKDGGEVQVVEQSPAPVVKPSRPPPSARRSDVASVGSTAGEIMRQGAQGNAKGTKKQALFGKPKGVAAFMKKPTEAPPQPAGPSAIDQMLSFVHSPYRPVSAPVGPGGFDLFDTPQSQEDAPDFS